MIVSMEAAFEGQILHIFYIIFLCNSSCDNEIFLSAFSTDGPEAVDDGKGNEEARQTHKPPDHGTVIAIRRL